MLIGKLDKQITILKPIDVPDGQGGRNREWVTAFMPWASIKVPRSSVLNVQGAVSSDLTYEIVLRRDNQIVPGWRVLHEGKTFNVLHSYDGMIMPQFYRCEKFKRGLKNENVCSS